MEIFIGIIGGLCLVLGVLGFIGTMVGLLLDWDILSDWSYASIASIISTSYAYVNGYRRLK